MATLAPDFQRIADSLLDQIKSFDHKVASRSVGTVSSIGDGVALASGLEMCIRDSFCRRRRATGRCQRHLELLLASHHRGNVPLPGAGR